MVSSYTLTIRCCDNNYNTGDGTNKNKNCDWNAPYDEQKLTINVKPAPYFVNIPYTISIPETTAVQTTVYVVSATDITKGINDACSLCSFKLAPASSTNWFQISKYRKYNVNITTAYKKL